MWDTLTKWPSWNGLGHGHQEDENSKSLFSKKNSPSWKSQDWNFIMTLESRIFHDYDFHFDLMIFHLDDHLIMPLKVMNFSRVMMILKKFHVKKSCHFRGRIALSKRKENALFRISRHRFSDIQMSQISTFSLKGRLIKLNEWLIKWLLAWLSSIKLKITYHLMKAIFERFVIFDFFQEKEQYFFFHIDKSRENFMTDMKIFAPNFPLSQWQNHQVMEISRLIFPIWRWFSNKSWQNYKNIDYQK